MQADLAELIELLALPGCPVCRLKAKYERHFLDMTLYEYVNDPETQQRFTDGHGLCDDHVRLAYELHDALGCSILYRAVLRELDGPLKEAAEALGSRWQSKRKRAASHLIPHAPCLVCQSRDTLVAHTVAFLPRAAQEAEFQAAYQAADGLCLHHLKQVAEVGGATVSWLVEQERAKLGRLKQELDVFLDKQDYRFRDLPGGPEADAWLRVMRKLSGITNLGK